MPHNKHVMKSVIHWDRLLACITWKYNYNICIKRRLGGEWIYLNVEDPIGAHQANWTPCYCPQGPIAFSSSWISFGTSRRMFQTDPWSSPLSPHVGTRALKLESSALVSCNITDEPRVILYNCNVVSEFFIMFLKGWWIVVSEKQDDQSGFVRGSQEVFIYCQWASNDIDLDFH